MLNTKFAVENDWGNGFQGAISLTAEGSVPTYGWQISFTATFEITNIWGAQIVSHDGDRYTIEAMPWNSEIQSGQSIEIGFTGIPGGTGIAVSNLQTNGEILSQDLTEPEPGPAPIPPVVSNTDNVVTENGSQATSQVPLIIQQIRR